MNDKIKWLIGIAGVGLLFAFCMFVPLLADAWSDKITAEEISYESLVYEPYEISYYSTFEDKLGAIADGLSDEATPYVINLEEGEDAADDDTLIQLVNTELSGLWQNGLLPEKYEVTALSDRTFSELYVMPQNENSMPLVDICFWTLTAVAGDSQLTICMDNSFYKIYCFLLRQAGESQEVDDWKNAIEKSDGKSLAEGWRTYWGLSDAEIVDAFGEKNIASITDGRVLKSRSYVVSIVDADMVSRYDLVLQNEQRLGLSYRMVENRYLVTGIKGFMMQFGYI
jgi:hypothetical protein